MLGYERFVRQTEEASARLLDSRKHADRRAISHHVAEIAHKADMNTMVSRSKDRLAKKLGTSLPDLSATSYEIVAASDPVIGLAPVCSRAADATSLHKRARAARLGLLKRELMRSGSLSAIDKLHPGKASTRPVSGEARATMVQAKLSEAMEDDWVYDDATGRRTMKKNHVDGALRTLTRPVTDHARPIGLAARVAPNVTVAPSLDGTLAESVRQCQSIGTIDGAYETVEGKRQSLMRDALEHTVPVKGRGAKAGRPYPGMGDYTPMSHSFRDRHVDKELYGNHFSVGGPKVPKIARSGGGGATRSAELAETVALEFEAQNMSPPPSLFDLNRQSEFVESEEPDMSKRDKGRSFEHSLSCDDLYNPYRWVSWSLPVTRSNKRTFEFREAVVRRREVAKRLVREEVGQAASDSHSKVKRFQQQRVQKLLEASQVISGAVTTVPELDGARRLVKAKLPTGTASMTHSVGKLPLIIEESPVIRATTPTPSTGRRSRVRGQGGRGEVVTFQDQSAFQAKVGVTQIPSWERTTARGRDDSVAYGGGGHTVSGVVAGPTIALPDGMAPSSPVRARPLCDTDYTEKDARIKGTRDSMIRGVMVKLRAVHALKEAVAIPVHMREIHDNKSSPSNDKAAPPSWALRAFQPKTLNESSVRDLDHLLTIRVPNEGQELLTSTHRKPVVDESVLQFRPALGISPSAGTIPERPLFAMAGADGPVAMQREAFQRRVLPHESMRGGSKLQHSEARFHTTVKSYRSPTVLPRPPRTIREARKQARERLDRG
jgi:hypothetical protein